MLNEVRCDTLTVIKNVNLSCLTPIVVQSHYQFQTKIREQVNKCGLKHEHRLYRFVNFSQ
jgi:hypothetical protein